MSENAHARPSGGSHEPLYAVNMNADHADALVLYCKAFSKATETQARLSDCVP
jgi:putative heme iron utilization protein